MGQKRFILRRIRIKHSDLNIGVGIQRYGAGFEILKLPVIQQHAHAYAPIGGTGDGFK